jgi:hypothetical protein
MTDQYNLRLIQFLLDLHDRICLSRILVFLQIYFNLRKGNRSWIRKRRLRDFGYEIIQNLGQQ